MIRRLAILFALAAGCGGGETSVRLIVEAGSAQPRALRLTLWGDGLLRPPADISLGGKSLPGSVLITHLDAATPHFRLLVDGLDGNGALIAEGAARVTLEAGQQVTQTVQLTDGRLPDGDGDGVPDEVDDCPSLADADQKCAGPDGAAASDLSSPATDLAAADLAAVTDLAGADLLRGPACPAFALFCDDFESGDFSKWGTLYNSGGGSTLTVDGTQAYRGSHAAHATATGGLIWAPHSFTPIASGMVAFRAYFLTPAALSPSVYFFFLHRAEAVPADTDYVVGFDNLTSSGQWTVFNKNSGTGYGMTGSFAPMQWHCVELDLTLSSANHLELYLDGAGPQAIDVAAADGVSSLGELDIGVSYQSGATSDQWYFDDVVLATQHIGCE